VNKRKSESDIPGNMHYLDLKADNPNNICNLFSSFFKSVFQPSDVANSYSTSDIQNLDLYTRSDILISNISLSANSILSELKSLDASKGPGTDNLPAIFLKNTASTIYKPLHIIFNRCLGEGVCPKIWKSARVTPVHKGGSKTDVANYRPISILCVLAKLFERLIHGVLYAHIHKNILPQQHGFVSKRSTTTNLMVYATDLFNNLDDNKQTDAVYTDFRKAFDRVDHLILLKKIAFNGIRGNLWRWFKSYISNRTQKIVINGHESETITVTSGVPQGSIIGPLLFVIYINDINKCFTHCKFLLYADDLKIYRTIENNNDHHKFQDDLNRLTAYCEENKLSLSLDKCKCITFTKKKTPTHYNYSLCNTHLDRVQNIRDLGVIIDTKLTLDLHIESICNKAYKMYGFVVRACKEFRIPATFIHIYKSLIRSQLEYATSIWDPFYNKYSEQIEKVQKKFLRYLHFKCFRGRLSYHILLDKYKLLCLKYRRLQVQAKLLYDFCNNKYDCIDVINNIGYQVPVRPHRRACRTDRFFATNKSRTNAGKRSPMLRLTDTYNEYFNDIDIYSTKIGSFKKLVVNKLYEINT
jgi:hypothetical protein